jgi:hypothetical protein
VFDGFFGELGLEEYQYPKIRIVETYEGSLIFEAIVSCVDYFTALYTLGSIAYKTPEIVEKLKELKRRMSDKFNDYVNKVFIEKILGKNDSCDCKNSFADTILIIDARPMMGLSPDILCKGSVQLSIIIASGGIMIKNLSGDVMENMSVSIFHGRNLKRVYTYKGVLIPAHQTVTIGFDSFRRKNKGFAFDRSQPTFNCWVSDGTSFVCAFEFPLFEQNHTSRTE